MTDAPTDADLAARYADRLRRELSEIADASTATRDNRRPVELDQQSVGRLCKPSRRAV